MVNEIFGAMSVLFLLSDFLLVVKKIFEEILIYDVIEIDDLLEMMTCWYEIISFNSAILIFDHMKIPSVPQGFK